VNQPYSQTLLVNEATNPLWALQNGALPVGLTLDPSSGTISGIPTQVGAPHLKSARQILPMVQLRRMLISVSMWLLLLREIWT
jgi:hypothetical protein